MLSQTENTIRAKNIPPLPHKFNSVQEFENMMERFAEHLSKGLSEKSFPLCDFRTLRNYIFNEEFFRVALGIDDNDNSINTEKYVKQYQEAKTRNRLFWESIGIQGTIGAEIKRQFIDESGKVITEKITPKRFNALAWIFNMKNRFRSDWNDKFNLDVSGEIRTLNIDIQLVEKMKDDPNIRKLVRDLQFQIGNNIQSGSVSELPDERRVEDTTAFETD